MPDDILQIKSIKNNYVLSSKQISNHMMNMDVNVDGYNEDLTEKYFWHMNFAYYTGKGYTALKLEDYHYFSEGSQYGGQMRQVKGGTVRAFQENFQQLIQLIRSHLIPLLKEVKNAHMYKEWFDKITENDNELQKLKSQGISDTDSRIKKVRGARNEAINHLKDKWVSEVDQGKMWQITRPAGEQGLDFALLPQLFFGTNLDDPLQRKKDLKTQLDEDIYSIDISYQAKEQVARFMYRFYTWLPTAIADTNTTFRLKISALKNIYAQVQMQINFMKPLLIEIERKSEGFEKSNFYRDHELENPEFVNLFDYSYSFVKILGIRNLGKAQRGKNDLGDLDFSKYGLFINDFEIAFGNNKGKTGFLVGEENGKYILIPSKTKEITDEKFKELKKNRVLVNKEDLRTFPIMEKDFSQRRRIEIVQTQQGPQQMPYMKNRVEYKGYVWNIYEVASYRENLKVDNLKLLETFIEELAVIRDDLLIYVNYFHGESIEEISSGTKSAPQEEEKETDWTFVLGPFQAFGNMVSLLFPNWNNSKTKKDFNQKHKDYDRDEHHMKNKVSMAEDVWKVYTIFKKNQQLIQY